MIRVQVTARAGLSNMKTKNNRRNGDNDPVRNKNMEEDTITNTQDTDMVPEEMTDGANPAGDSGGDASEIDILKEQLDKEKKEYLFLMAEFDNFRKRTIREKSELMKNAGENVLKGLLPIVDDFERGLKAVGNNSDVDSVVEGMQLIYNKLIKYLAQNGVKEFDPEDKNFDTERHEAISVVPVADESERGKILDTVEKGYMINDKVLRHAKVVVGQ